MLKVILFGIGSTLTVDIEETCGRLGIEIVAAIRNVDGPVCYSDLSRVHSVEYMPEICKSLPVVIPLFTPGYRKAAVDHAQRCGLDQFANILDPTSVLPRSTLLGRGVYINAGCTLGGAGVFGDFTFINRSASIGHHASLKEFVSIGPGAVLAGQVTVGRGAMVGAGAVVLPRVVIGENSVIAAGAVVTRPVPSNCMVAGNPAKILKSDIAGYDGASV